MKKAILFIVFNRLDTTKKVFAEIRKAKPPRLYIASDGARKAVVNEQEVVESVRKYVETHIDWDCKLLTLYRTKNLGCGKAVSSAISWFFKNEKDGIILEDDCLPNQSFFNYCEVLLDRYRDNKQVYHISGDQFVKDYKSKYSYYFAKIQHCWGWASWSDRWADYQYDLNKIPDNVIQKFSKSREIQNYWSNILTMMRLGKIDTWDYQWVFSIVNRNGLCINPSSNLVSNIGFGNKSTHTSDKDNPYANLGTYPVDQIKHPPSVILSDKEVDILYRQHFGIIMDRRPNILQRLANKTKSILKKHEV